MVSRNKQKMEEKLAEVAKDSSIKTRAVVFDFSTQTTIQEYKEHIAAKISDLDIGLLFLNAGFAMGGPFTDVTENEVSKVVTVNTLHPVFLLKTVID